MNSTFTPQPPQPVLQSETIATLQAVIADGSSADQAAASVESDRLHVLPFASKSGKSRSPITQMAVPRQRSQSSLTLVVPFPLNTASESRKGNRRTTDNVRHLFPRNNNDGPPDCA
jgi:hypothetical protein